MRERAVGGACVLRARGTATVTSAVLGGIGLAPLPCIIGDRESRLVRLSADVIGSCPILLIVHPDLTLVARVRKTLDFLVEVFERDAMLWSGVLALDLPTGSV